MFPLSDDFIQSLITTIAPVALVPMLFLLAERKRWLAILPLLFFGAVLVSQASNLGKEDYSDGVLFAVLLVSFSLMLVVAGFVWAIIIIFVSRYFRKSKTILSFKSPAWCLMAFAAISPSLVILGIFFEDQIVPDAKCSNEGLEVIFSDQAYLIRPEIGVQIYSPLFNVNRDHRSIYYSNQTQDKEGMRDICDFTDGGNKKIQQSWVYISTESIKNEIDRLCALKSEEQKPKHLSCSQYSPEIYKNVYRFQISESKPKHEKMGMRCQDWYIKSKKTKCSLRREIEPGVYLGITSALVAKTEEKELPAQIEKAFELTAKTVLEWKIDK